MKVKVKDNEHLVRDMSSMAILNVDKSALNRDMLFKEKMRRDKHVDEAINKLNDDVSDIKNSLSKLLQILENRGP